MPYKQVDLKWDKFLQGVSMWNTFAYGWGQVDLAEWVWIRQPPVTRAALLRLRWWQFFHELLRHFPPGSIVIPIHPPFSPPPSPNDDSVGILFRHLQLESPKIDW